MKLAALAVAAAAICSSPARATVNSTSTSATYTGNGATTAFTVTFRFLATADLVVTVAGATKILGTDYSVTGAGGTSGTVTFTTAPPVAAAVVITRSVDYLQKLSIRGSRTLDTGAVENQLDKLAMGEQQLQALYINPPATVLPANVVAKLNGIRYADQFANIQAAITDAGTTGSVIIPPGYAGVDTYVNPNHISILDLRTASTIGPRLNGVRYADQFATIQAAVTDAGTTGTVLIPASYTGADTFTNTNNIPVIDLRGGPSRWRGFTDVTDHGAKCDDVNDDTNAIKEAVATGLKLHFPDKGKCRITSTVTAQSQAGWFGAGPGNIFDSAGGSGITVIRCIGALSPCVVAPREMRGLHFDGVNLTGTGVTLGADNGTFVAGVKWREVTFRDFSVAIHAYNFFNTSWSDLVLQGNHEGIRIDPTVTTPDGGYFTSTDWTNIYIADNDVDGLFVSVPLGTRTWSWNNVVIERNGASGTFQASLVNASLSARGAYFEGSSTKTALKTNNISLSITDGYFNGTGGIDFTSNAISADLWHVVTTSATDVIAGLSSLSHLRVFGNSSLQSDPRALIGGRAIVQQSAVGGSFISRQGNTVQTTLTYAASMSIDAKQGDIFIVTATDANAFTFTVTGGTQGQCIGVRVRNTSGGALGAVTWPPGFKMAAWTSPATGSSRAITLCSDGTNYIESSRTPADVPN